MSVESATYISQLDATLPSATDLKSEGDDHLRLLKACLKAQFTGLGASAVTATAAELNAVVGRTADIAAIAGAASTGASIKVATQAATDNTTKAASTAMVQSAILASSGISAVLPAQGGNSGKYLSTDGSNASWASASSGLNLIATITPTVAANIDFLTTFSSTYDNYLIIGSGLTAGTTDYVALRFAVAGSVDSGSNYYSGVASGTETTVANTNQKLTPNLLSTGLGGSFTAVIKNANDATNLKTVEVFGVSQTAATPGYSAFVNGGAYKAANAVSGFRLLLNGGNNFAATGKVRVYGYANS